MSEIQQKSHKRLLIIMLSIAVGMFGFCYLLVPIYNVLCQQLGINGKTGGRVVYDASAVLVDESRTVTVQFITNINENLQWSFFPLVKKIKMHPGEMKRVAFFAENKTGQAMTVQAIPSVAPGLAARYLKKTECFCFTQQTLNAHEVRDMPLLFHLDPELPKNINTLSLSYTLFDVTGRVNHNNRPLGKIS